MSDWSYYFFSVWEKKWNAWCIRFLRKLPCPILLGLTDLVHGFCIFAISAGSCSYCWCIFKPRLGGGMHCWTIIYGVQIIWVFLNMIRYVTFSGLSSGPNWILWSVKRLYQRELWCMQMDWFDSGGFTGALTTPHHSLRDSCNFICLCLLLFCDIV